MIFIQNPNEIYKITRLDEYDYLVAKQNLKKSMVDEEIDGKEAKNLIKIMQPPCWKTWTYYEKHKRFIWSFFWSISEEEDISAEQVKYTRHYFSQNDAKNIEYNHKFT